jgi:hypothetical protein
MMTNEMFWGLGKLQKVRRQRKDSSYDNKEFRREGIRMKRVGVWDLEIVSN